MIKFKSWNGQIERFPNWEDLIPVEGSCCQLLGMLMVENSAIDLFLYINDVQIFASTFRHFFIFLIEDGNFIYKRTYISKWEPNESEISHQPKHDINRFH